MSESLTPKQVAKALGISESSLKRWCDRGRLPVQRTAGGHRRLRKSDILRLVRQGELHLAHPEALGLHVFVGRGDWTTDQARRAVLSSLQEGNAESATRTCVEVFLGGQSVATICDDILAPALHDIGALWEANSLEVYEERRSTILIARVLHRLRELLPQPLPNAKIAVGGCPAGDPYGLATQMVELVLLECGWRASSLGGPLPFDTLRQAVQSHQPRLFWLSVSHLDDPEAFLQEYNRFFDDVPATTAVAIGGQALGECLRKRMRYAVYCDSMQNIVDFVRAIQAPGGQPPEASDN